MKPTLSKKTKRLLTRFSNAAQTFGALQECASTSYVAEGEKEYERAYAALEKHLIEQQQRKD